MESELGSVNERSDRFKVLLLEIGESVCVDSDETITEIIAWDPVVEDWSDKPDKSNGELRGTESLTMIPSSCDPKLVTACSMEEQGSSIVPHPEKSVPVALTYAKFSADMEDIQNREMAVSIDKELTLLKYFRMFINH